jgi:flagellar hook-associated protein 1 FlgK
MSTMSAIMNISLNGLRTYQSAIAVTSQNIANVDTGGYSRQSVSIQENYRWGNQGGLVLSGSQWAGSSRVCNQFVNAQLAKSQSDLGRYQTETTYLEYVEALFDESEGHGLNEALAEFWNSWQKLVNDPSGSAVRSGVVDAAVNLAGLLNSASTNLQSLQQDLDDEIKADVASINSLTSQIASLNREITSARSMGQSTNSLQDALDTLNNELQALVNVNTYWNDSGQLCVALANGKPLVEGSRAWSLDTQVDSATGLSAVLWLDSGGTAHDTGNCLTSGSLGASLAVRDEFIPECLADLDSLAETLRDQVNTLLLSGYDLTGQAGVALFTGSGAVDLAVSQGIIDDPGLIAVAATAESAPGDASLAQAIAELQNTSLMSGGTATCDKFYAALVSRIGSEVATVTAKYDRQSELCLFYSNYRESISGVFTDEETANLILYQQAYNASAKAMTVLQEMLETIINI